MTTANITFLSPFDAYLTSITNAQRVYAVRQFEHLEKKFRECGQADAAIITRGFAAKIVGELFEGLGDEQI